VLDLGNCGDDRFREANQDEDLFSRAYLAFRERVSFSGDKWPINGAVISQSFASFSCPFAFCSCFPGTNETLRVPTCSLHSAERSHKSQQSRDQIGGMDLKLKLNLLRSTLVENCTSPYYEVPRSRMSTLLLGETVGQLD
jgi:hypothetical protein